MPTTYQIEISGLSPMLHHSSAGIGMDKESGKKKGGEAINGDPEEWRKSVYFDDNEGVYFPSLNIEACLVEASKNFKVTGRATATKYFKSSISINEDMVPFFVNGKKISSLEDIAQGKDGCQVFKMSVRNPATRMRNTRYRARFDNWSCKFNILVLTDDYIPQARLKEVLEYAGMYVGLGDFRPRFGRFLLKSIKKV